MKCPAVFLTSTDTAGISLYGREIPAVPVQVESRRLEDRVLTLSGEVVVDNCLGTRGDLLHALDLAQAESIPLGPTAVHHSVNRTSPSDEP